VTSEESAELRRLRAENRELRRANEILKAAAVESTGQRNSAASLSAGVSKSRVLRGRVFSFAAIAFRSS
jgi:transposase